MITRAFVTEGGVEVPAVTARQMREVDRLAIEELGPNLYQMMENAGRNLALSVFDVLGPGWSSVPVVVLAGTGGNGGGGICAARHLANRGSDVTVAVADPAGLSSVPAQQLAVYLGTAGKLASIDELDELRPGLIVDAVIGYGLAGSPRAAVRRLIEWMQDRSAPIVSLDVPSGVDATSGETPGAHVRASATVTLALPKTGLDPSVAGALSLADIGIPRQVYRRAGIDVPPRLFGSAYRVAIRPRRESGEDHRGRTP